MTSCTGGSVLAAKAPKRINPIIARCQRVLQDPVLAAAEAELTGSKLDLVGADDGQTGARRAGPS